MNGTKGQFKTENSSFLNGHGCEKGGKSEKERTGNRSFPLPEWTRPNRIPCSKYFEFLSVLFCSQILKK